MPLPTINTVTTAAPAPLEGQDVPEGTALKANFMGTFAGNLGTSLMAHAYSGGQTVPYDDAVKTFRSEGLDPGVLPKTGPISQGYLDAVKNQQIEIQKDRDLVGRSHIGTVGQFATSIAGGALDPVFLGIGAVTGGAGLAVKGASLTGRLAIGGAEGAVTMGAYDAAKKTVGTAQGDPDITSANILHDMAWGGAAGAVLHGALGERPTAPGGAAYLPMIEKAENTAGYAKSHGIPENEVVSSAGAIGKYQVTPGTARQYGFDPGRLKEPDYNRQAATAILDDLHKRFGDDPEAIAVGYNAGPGRAMRFVRAGHDRSVLLPETRGYLASVDRSTGRENFGTRPMPPETQQAVATAAVAQAGEDSPVNVKPLLDQAEQEDSFRTNPFKIADEHAQEVSRLETEGMQAAVPKPGSIIGADPDTAATLSRMDNNENVIKTPASDNKGLIENPELADLQKMTTDAVGDAEHAHGLAHPEAVEGEESPLHTALAADDEAIKGDGDLAKAVDAAVRCAAVKGVE